jgi:hypothetical protein
MRNILGILFLGLVSASVQAQTCNLTLSTTITIGNAAAGENAQPVGSGSMTWSGLATGAGGGHELMKGKMDKLLKVQGQIQDKGGPLTIALKQDGTCPGNSTLLIGGVTYPGAAKLLRTELQLGDELLKVAEGRGNKHPWKD